MPVMSSVDVMYQLLGKELIKQQRYTVTKGLSLLIKLWKLAYDCLTQFKYKYLKSWE